MSRTCRLERLILSLDSECQHRRLVSGNRSLIVNLDYLVVNWRRVLDLTWDHVILTVIALAIALIFAIPLGIVVAHWPRTSLPIVGVLGVIYTIPSLALLAFLIPVFGLVVNPQSWSLRPTPKIHSCETSLRHSVELIPR